MEDEELALRMRIDEVRLSAAPIEGWLHDGAGEILYRFARFKAPVPTIVELGSWKGKSTVWLGSAIKDRGEGSVHCVDLWTGGGSEESIYRQLLGEDENQLYHDFYNNIVKQGLQDIVIPIQCDTIKASRQWDYNKEIGLLFIDASHEYEFVKRDFEFWSPMISSGGYVIFDDVPEWAGPTRLVSELPKYYQHLITAFNISVYQKW